MTALALLLVLVGPVPPTVTIVDERIEDDPARLRVESVWRVVGRIRGRPVWQVVGPGGGRRCFQGGGRGAKVYVFCFDFQNQLVDGKPAYRYAVGMEGTNPSAAELNIGRFLLSAYRQEVEPGYGASDGASFVSLPAKSVRGLWFRNALSMGWAAQYAYRDNPFSDHRWLAIGVGHGLEALHYGAIYFSAVHGRGRLQRVGVPVFMVGALLLWKLFYGTALESHVEAYNEIVESGYRIPRSVGEPSRGGRVP